MKNVDKLLREGRFAVADNGFSARVVAAVEGQQHVPTFVLRTVSIWRTYYLPALGTVAGIVFLGLLMSRVVDLGELGSQWCAQTELIAQRLTRKTIAAPILNDEAPLVVETKE